GSGRRGRRRGVVDGEPVDPEAREEERGGVEDPLCRHPAARLSGAWILLGLRPCHHRNRERDPAEDEEQGGVLAEDRLRACAVAIQKTEAEPAGVRRPEALSTDRQ